MYGLQEKTGKILDSEWFWQEVELRATNNYGDWKNKAIAFRHLYTAITEICNENKVKGNLRYLFNHKQVNKIVSNMLDGN